MTRYQYTVITRENSAACELDSRFWENHPDWRFMVRTNIRRANNNRVWISGGGQTKEEAIAAAEFSILALAGIPRMMTRELMGAESQTIIKN